MTFNVFRCSIDARKGDRRVTMKTVQPIRDMTILNQFKENLRERGSKYYIMALIGFNTGLRISDILTLKADIVHGNHILIKEKKTGKTKRFLINDYLKKELNQYIQAEQLRPDDYLIYSNKKDLEGNQKAISRVQAYTVLREEGEKLGLSEVGTHTLRKTFGYWHYKQYKDIAILQEIFNHSAPSITLKYIGITNDIIDDTIKEFYL